MALPQDWTLPQEAMPSVATLRPNHRDSFSCSRTSVFLIIMHKFRNYLCMRPGLKSDGTDDSFLAGWTP